MFLSEHTVLGRRGRPGGGTWRSLVSALDWGPRGREFKSRRPDENGEGPVAGYAVGLFLFRPEILVPCE